ncbi:DndE family protein [Candidatus Methanarcanum hacksteinii]|uniref:DndE family protein n=1 Tax=Candidatus Methanarcanum hacksteinii TaxID=2911857 RepID=UPI0037DCC44F
MADKLKLSNDSSDKLNFLSNRLNIKRNLVCRLAISVSVSQRKKVDTTINSDTDGYEFNKSTIFGPDEIYFKAVVCYVQQKAADSDFFNIIIRNHIENGLDIMYNDYQKVNSPVGYLTSFVV